MGKTVLILGNGFDLAHGLPTRYSDFLDFIKFFLTNVHDKDKTVTELLKKYNMNEKCIKYFSGKYDYFQELLEKNIWCNYFLNNFLRNCLGRNWVDFESEIKLCIKYIDEHSKYLSRSVDDMFKKNTLIGDEDNAGIRYSAFKAAVLGSSKKSKDIFELRKALYEDLTNLIKALEIYLTLVEFISTNATLIKIIKPDYSYIINFNYTNTYKNIYSYYKLDKVFYIHGELNHKPNNMVLGIDEYWSEEERDSHTNFTIFKKFAQRIRKNTGIESYKWFDEIKSDYEKNNEVAEVFIFGHSLDVTDKDILYDYLNSEATSVTIYCRDEETEGEYIANVIKIIGEKRLLEKVNQYPQKFKFVTLNKNKSNDEEENEEKNLSTSGAAT